MPTFQRILFGENPRRTAVRILVLAGISFVTFKWILIPVRTQGPSMRPTYESGRLHLVNKLAYAFSAPARGDIVAIRLAGPRVLYVKRIVALPGERVDIVAGEVQIDGQALIEPYVVERAPWSVPAIQVAEDEYFVIGDNRGMRVSDHDFGRVERSRIVGKVVF